MSRLVTAKSAAFLFLFGVPVTHQGFRHFQPLATRVAASLDDCPDNRSPRIHVRWERAFVQQSLVTGLPGDRLTEVKGLAHTIPTPHINPHKPLTLKNYRLPKAHQDEVQKQVEIMLEQDIIKPSQSPWNFPLLVVPKKIDASGKRKWRICVDFRQLNNETIGDSFPLPNIQDILDKLGRARYFSALDCASGYWQIPLAKEDQCKTAFSTTSGHFEFKRMPFGLKSAPATFQRFMNTILSHMIGTRCFVYVDDLMIAGETLEEHHTRLRSVFDLFRQYQVQIEPDKCEFLKEELKYLGHIITKEGISPDNDKVKVIQEFPTPKNAKDVKSFLGLAGYYRKCIVNFSEISKSLNDLLKKGKSWQWSEEEEKSFQRLKRALSEAPVLQFPDFTKPFVLTTDASNVAIGAILSQGIIGKDKPIAYASRTLNGAELNYSTTDKELLAIIWACKHFRPYLLGTKFTLVTDHQPLKWMMNVKDPGSRILRWRLLLEEYDFEVIHKAGKRNVNADCLSRLTFNVDVERKTLEMDEDRKYRIMKELHECPIGGHQGVQRTYERIKLYCSWPDMLKDITNYIRNCKTCQVNKTQQVIPKAPMQITDTPENIWDKIALDIVGPLTQSLDVAHNRLRRTAHLQHPTNGLELLRLRLLWQTEFLYVPWRHIRMSSHLWSNGQRVWPRNQVARVRIPVGGSYLVEVFSGVNPIRANAGDLGVTQSNDNGYDCIRTATKIFRTLVKEVKEGRLKDLEKQ
ncbi:hypothetical protein ANN_19746 [Periplaneta americana]|uniref:RNA-directed DNA polymerase n=1 Tax=Periplaneta americana TaxID=6978 RepID=A0ABQ8SBV7_PERAM|nr:hypothetical protein ANN_19746 [Periplaneta americana]